MKLSNWIVGGFEFEVRLLLLEDVVWCWRERKKERKKEREGRNPVDDDKN
jgi:hypothetical protein